LTKNLKFYPTSIFGPKILFLKDQNLVHKIGILDQPVNKKNQKTGSKQGISAKIENFSKFSKMWKNVNWGNYRMLEM